MPSAVSLKLIPHGTAAMATAGMLSIDGRAKTFDLRANGMVRTEGLGSHVLQPSIGSSKMAQRLGSAVQSDGRSASLTAPNGVAQQKLLLVAFATSSRTSGQVDVIEAHGTGTKLGDPTEGAALRSVLGDSQSDAMIFLGAAKANIGHSEAPSGVLGMMKLVQLLSECASPGNAHLRRLNMLLNLPGLFSLAQQPSSAARTVTGGVSSFGFSGVIAHVVLERADAQFK